MTQLSCTIHQRFLSVQRKCWLWLYRVAVRASCTLLDATMTLYIRRRSKVRSCDGGESVMCLVKVAHAHLFNVRPATFVTCNLPHRSRPSVNASPTECSHNAVNLNLEYVLYYTIKALCISRSGRLMCRISGASYMSQRLELSSALQSRKWQPIDIHVPPASINAFNYSLQLLSCSYPVMMMMMMSRLVMFARSYSHKQSRAC